MLLRLPVAVSLLVASLAAFGSARAQRLDIVDVYHELQVAQPNGFPAYEVSEKDGRATASGGTLYGPRARVTTTLDRARLYLRFDDTGDREGATPFVTEMAIWLDPEGAPLFGLSERALRDGVPFGGRLRFYSRASGRWNLVTDQVFPRLDAAVCQTREEELDETTAAFESLGRAITLLPRTGTDVQVWCVRPSPEEGRGVSVIWERGTGRFHQGPALAGPAPWPDVPPVR